MSLKKSDTEKKVNKKNGIVGAKQETLTCHICSNSNAFMQFPARLLDVVNVVSTYSLECQFKITTGLVQVSYASHPTSMIQAPPDRIYHKPKRHPTLLHLNFRKVVFIKIRLQQWLPQNIVDLLWSANLYTVFYVFFNVSGWIVHLYCCIAYDPLMYIGLPFH